MALIKCPECNKEISDKSEVCIHCGYPLKQLHLFEIINGEKYDLSFLKDEQITQIKKIQMVKEISGCDLFKAKEIVLKYCPTASTTITTTPNLPKCPTCGSTNIKKITTAEKAGNTFLFGVFGTKRHKTWHCKNCGHEW